MMKLIELSQNIGIVDDPVGYQVISSFRTKDLRDILNSVKPEAEEIKIAVVQGKKNQIALLLKTKESSNWIGVSPVRKRGRRCIPIKEVLTGLNESRVTGYHPEEVTEALNAVKNLASTKDILDRYEIYSEVVNYPSKYPVFLSRTEKRIKKCITHTMNQIYPRVNGVNSRNPAWKIS